MALTVPWVPRVPSLLLPLLPLLHLWLFSSASALEMIDQAPPLSCSEGLTDCSVSSAFLYDAVPPDPEDTVDVRSVELKVILCCSDRQDCEPCLQIFITVQEVDNEKEVFEESGDHSDEDEHSIKKQTAGGSGQYVLPKPRALVKVCHSSPGSIEHCKALLFRPSYSVPEQQPTQEMRLLLTEKVKFGSPVVVHVHAHSRTTHNITIPSLQEVCSQNLTGAVKECDAPRLQAVPDQERDVVLLQLDNPNTSQEVLMCQMFWNEIPGEVFEWHKGQREMIISSNSVAPCLCFQVWWKGKTLRTESCPFKEQQALERMQHNVSVSMVESQTREGGTVLSWNVTAPCRLEAELWLCKRDSAGGRCEEVTGSRQRMHSQQHAGWRASRHGHWKKGEFINVSSHPSFCVQIKVHGMNSYLEPQCPFATPRWRWSLLLLLGLLLICLAILGAYFVQGVLKGYVWRWLKDDDVKGAVGGGHVVLLYPPDGEQALPGMMCRLGSSLQALGFSVSLDLWSQAELSVLGPVPWLHSRLDRLQRQGGKVVLVLTQAAWAKAEEWGSRGWERDTPRERNRDTEEEEAEKSCRASSPHLDVFSASLSCILADYLQGRAGERFILVQFESLPPEPPDCCRPLPELFRGLHLFSLPSQSLGFLTELAGGRHAGTASARRRRAGGLRVASRALARGLSGFTAGSTVLRLAGLSQDCVGVGAEDSWETVPLQPCLTTPPSSPDTCPKGSGMDWV
ncbi:interleukin-17 receptor C isoform X2 [Centroberyx gerrardi]|uniref:interleukin-17 receptor C isoform X2 n=1 Tax=Centroberyx gerrardi TaxID=166262 RepID=UPI003AB0E908